MLKMQLIVKEELMGRASDPHGDPVFNNHDLNMDVLYRTGEKQQGILTCTPRLVSINMKDSRRMFFTSTKEGTNPYSWGSTSSRSESIESELFAKSHLVAQQNFSCHQSFISKPIHPLSLPDITSTREAFDPAVMKEEMQYIHAGEAIFPKDVDPRFSL
ncbi:hypothetical protein QN277_014238 [Acacia crassicarpa]|uniref:Misato Segment II tubulin-like domain-containing protein n=1 Tax=Acacia crassicarpa TaxID=499986 RepID=A0AAE1TFA6_9FABA|nr:hypothetical protein QN277_014238 [Acacia crassicarpa]